MRVDDPRNLPGVVGIGGIMSFSDLLDETVRVVRMLEGRPEPRLGVQEPTVVIHRVMKSRIGPEAVRFRMPMAIYRFMPMKPSRRAVRRVPLDAEILVPGVNGAPPGFDCALRDRRGRRMFHISLTSRAAGSTWSIQAWLEALS